MSEEEELRSAIDEKRVKGANRFLQAAAYFIAATAKQENLEILIIVTDKHERPAVCMASSLVLKLQPQLLLDVLLQMTGGVEEIEKLAKQMTEMRCQDEEP